MILDVDDSGVVVDHINGNPSDNRKENLRVVSHLENMKNRKLSSANTSGITGVFQTKNGKWYARIMADGNEIWLGTFETKDDAAAARLAAEEKYFGDMWRRV